MAKNTSTITLFSAAAAILLAACLYLAIPTVEISPADGHSDVALGSPVDIEASPLSRIGKVAVYADGELLAMEYNLGTGDLSRDFGLRAGQQVRVEAKAASLIGLTREFTSTFTTVSPLKVQTMSVDGDLFAPGKKMSPQPTLSFSFNKPVTQAAVSLDGSDPIDLEVDPQDATIASLPPIVSLKQGATHVLGITATAEDSATLERLEIRAGVVPPLSLYGTVEERDGNVEIELDANTEFADPEAVRAALKTDLPDAGVTVEKQKIIISCSGLDQSAEYEIRLANAAGADGSFLETPLTMTLGFRAQPGISEAGGYYYTGYVYTPGGSGGDGAPSGGPLPGSGPPPGWPACCPWPPPQ